MPHAVFAGLLLAVFLCSCPALAQEPLTWEQYRDALRLESATDLAGLPQNAAGGGYAVDFVWTLFAAMLVFFMQAGFALVEAGFTRAKNVVNIFMKNLLDFSLGSIVFWAVGFGLMFGTSNGLHGTDSFFLSGHGDDPWSYAFLLFQTVFAATAATIVSGAVAERTAFRSYLLYTVLITGLIYPVFGSWAWGGLFAGAGWLEAPAGGWLHSLGLPPFVDFAGSTVVHALGGWAALAGAVVVGPRIGKYDALGRARAIPGHNMPFAVLGVFVLWIGWFGFNAGSTTGVTGSGEPWSGAGKAVALIAVNTNMAACGGAIAAAASTWFRFGKPELGLTANGALAGLVSVTAPCATVQPWAALLIGTIGGALVVESVLYLENRGVDDPVGAVSVHGVCGVWGTLAAAVFHVQGFSMAQLLTQVIGTMACFAWGFGASFALFRMLSSTIGLRVSPEEEQAGLDLVCHGGEGYPVDALPEGSAAE